MRFRDLLPTNWFRGKSNEENDRQVLADASQIKQIKPELMGKIAHAGLVYNSSASNTTRQANSYFPSEYDLSSVANSLDTESIFRRAVEKYIELIWKNGYTFIGKNTEAVQYIRTRFEQMAFVSDIPNKELFRQISHQIVVYSNAFVTKVRDREASGGQAKIVMNGVLLPPIAAYFVEDTVSMKIAVQENGAVSGYQQFIPGKTKIKVWKPHNVIHFYHSKKPGLNYGTPMVWPVLDDMRALRNMEQNVELLVYQHTIPLYHVKVGSKERPGLDDEIELVRTRLQQMPPNGCMVTSERYEIQVIGAEKESLDVTKYLEYFYARILGGLGMSSIGMGEGGTSNKATAQVLDRHMFNTTQTFQNVISDFVEHFMIKELLIEGGFSYDPSNPDTSVEMVFPPIDSQMQWEKENHYAQMYTQHCITEDEMRLEFGRDVIEPSQRDNMYWELITKPTAIIAASDEPYTGEAKMVATAQGQKPVTVKTPEGQQAHNEKKLAKMQGIKQTPAQNTGNQRNQPANQYGKSRSKPAFPKNDSLDKLLGSLDALRQDVMNSYTEYRENVEDYIDPLRSMESTIIKYFKEDLSKVEDIKLDSTDYFARKGNEIIDDTYTKIKTVFGTKDTYRGVLRLNSIFENAKDNLTILVEQSMESKKEEKNE